MVDELEDKKSENDLEADFPSFLRSDNPDNYDHDINHFLEDDALSNTDVSSSSPSTTGWNDGFEDAEQDETNSDWDLDLGDINTPIENLNLGDVETTLSDFDESSVSKATDDIAETIDNTEISPTDAVEVLPDDSEIGEAEISAAMDDEDVLDDTANASDLKILNDANDTSEQDEKKFPNPEDYMSFDIPLEEISRDEAGQEKERTEIPESEFIVEDSQVALHDLPKETSVENVDEPYVEVLPGNQNMNPDEYMSYDIPEEISRPSNSLPEENVVAEEQSVNAEAEPLTSSDVGSDVQEVEPEPLTSSDVGSDVQEVEPEPLTSSEVEADIQEVEDEKPAQTDNLSNDETSADTDSSQVSAPTPSRVEQAEKATLQMFKWYSGRINDNYYRFSAEMPSEEFVGSAEQNSIYVHVGTSAYGWNVAFDNGVTMNLADVREFQLRNGHLPSSNGVITYGQTGLRFSQVERIVVGSIPEYYHYGV